MQTFKHYPTGTAVPASPHSVCSSLPTLDAVIGYEEKRADVMQLMKQGYPRFVRHEWIHKLAQTLAEKQGLKAHQLIPTCSPIAAERLCNYALGAAPESIIETEELSCAVLPDDPEILKRGYAFLQHTGSLVTSRQAEDYLLSCGILEQRFQESTIAEGAESVILEELRTLSPQASRVWLARCGMASGFAALMAAAQIQMRRERTVWIQLGWLYLDTQRILENLLQQGARCIKVLDVYDLDSLLKTIADLGDEFAGIISEIPTNPLVQTADMEALSASVREHGGLMILDPSLVSLANLDALPWADLQVVSLTKYTGWGCDVLAGALMLNADSQLHDELVSEIPRWLEAPYPRDLERLAFEMKSWRPVVERLNQNTCALAEWLQSYPAVRAVHWAYHPRATRNYRQLTQSENRPGSILTLELKQPLASFYDRCNFVKGPSFGTDFTLMCPFMILAHYDLTNNPNGRAHLKSHGIDPDLIRLSCGTEPLDAIKEEFRRVLSA